MALPPRKHWENSTMVRVLPNEPLLSLVDLIDDLPPYWTTEQRSWVSNPDALPTSWTQPWTIPATQQHPEPTTWSPVRDRLLSDIKELARWDITRIKELQYRRFHGIPQHERQYKTDRIERWHQQQLFSALDAALLFAGYKDLLQRNVFAIPKGRLRRTYRVSEHLQDKTLRRAFIEAWPVEIIDNAWRLNVRLYKNQTAFEQHKQESEANNHSQWGCDHSLKSEFCGRRHQCNTAARILQDASDNHHIPLFYGSSGCYGFEIREIAVDGNIFAPR